MAFNLAIGHLTHPGRVRESNEDAFCVIGPTEIAAGFNALLAVADGMGGHQAGEVASKYTADKLRELFTSSKYREWVDFAPERQDYNILVLKEILERLNDEIHQMAGRRDDWRGMGTTATVALLVGTKAFIGHVGDSRAYLFSNGILRQVTKDHTWWIEQVEQGLMTYEQAAADPRKNRITRALGVSSLIKVDRIVEELQIGDTLLLCSDGLTNMVSDAEILQYLGAIPEPQQVCQALVQLANQKGGGDNITVVVGRLLGEASPSGFTTQPLSASTAVSPNSKPAAANPPSGSSANPVLPMSVLNAPETIPSSATPSRRRSRRRGITQTLVTFLPVVWAVCAATFSAYFIATDLRKWTSGEDVLFGVIVGSIIFVSIAIGLIIEIVSTEYSR